MGTRCGKQKKKWITIKILGKVREGEERKPDSHKGEVHVEKFEIYIQLEK